MVLRRATVGARRHGNEHPVTASEDLVQRALVATPIVDGHNDLPTALRGKAEYGVDGLDAVRPELRNVIRVLRDAEAVATNPLWPGTRDSR
jgi:hypothetical protein